MAYLLSDEEWQHIATESSRIYKEACEKAERTGRKLSHLSAERIEQKLVEHKAMEETLRSLKPCPLRWLFNCVR